MALLITWTAGAQAQALAVWNNASHGFRAHAMISQGPPADLPSTLGELKPDNALTRRFEEILGAEVDKLMGPLRTRIVLVSVDRQIVFRRYAFRALHTATPLGYSMSKSLTALTVGHVLCARPDVPLHSRLESLVPSLAGTSWGKSTIEDLLRMKSGAAAQEPQRHGWQSEDVAARHRPIYLGHHREDFLASMARDDLKQFQPGSRHQYSNYDTLALGFLVEALSGRPFHDYFFETVWRETAASRPGAWIVNGQNQTFTAAGFSAAPEDWIRLGHYVIDQIHAKSCLGQFIEKAVKPHEQSYLPSRCYGYQIWNWCRGQVFFFLGYGGQYLIMDPTRKWVAYAHQTTHDNDARLIELLALTR